MATSKAPVPVATERPSGSKETRKFWEKVFARLDKLGYAIRGMRREDVSEDQKKAWKSQYIDCSLWLWNVSDKVDRDAMRPASVPSTHWFIRALRRRENDWRYRGPDNALLDEVQAMLAIWPRAHAECDEKVS